jgi:glycolate oxidase
MVLYDGKIAGEEDRALDLSYQLLRICVDAGGSLSGEHGIGREKQCEMSYMYAEPDLATMQRLRRAFDPDNLANPGKLFPTPRLCGERRHGQYTPHAIEAAGLAEVF